MKQPAQALALVPLMALAVLLSGDARGASPIKVATFAPNGDYEVLGIVTASQEITPTLFGMGDPMKEAVNDLVVKLQIQALVRAANLVVLTQVTTQARGESVYLTGFGTALRVKGLERAGASTEAGADRFLGTWAGEMVKEGEQKGHPVTLNLMQGEQPGEYLGGMILVTSGASLLPDCEILFLKSGMENGILYLIGDSGGRRCSSYVGHAVHSNPDGTLNVRVYSKAAKAGWDKGTPEYQALLKRQ